MTNKKKAPNARMRQNTVRARARDGWLGIMVIGVLCDTKTA
jgi:hypothetical protein